MMDYEYWLKQIDEKVAELPIGTEFEIKKLFNKEVWNGLEPKERRTLGKEYKNKVNKGELSNVVCFVTKSDNHAHYRKIK